MTGSLYWLTLTALMTALFWLPYVVDRIAVRGLIRTMGNPQDDDVPVHAWSQRASSAHTNAIENLAVFGMLVLVANAVGAGNNAAIVMAAAVYFFARLIHFVVYTLGIPVLRTLAFATAWAATIAVALALIGVIG
jgi:uncharacterized MAPEG superfamily protein